MITAVTTRSFWALAALMAVVVVAVGVCVGPALFGEQHGAGFGGPIGGLIGALWVSRTRDGDFWRLERAGRERVVAAIRTGVPTHDPQLDAVAAARLERAAGSPRSEVVARAVVALVAVALPVAAAVRVDSWYLVCLVPLSPLVLDAVQTGRRENPRVRLARFRAAAG